MHGGVKDENVIDFSISVNAFVPDFIILEDNFKYEKKYTYVEWIEEDFRKIFGRVRKSGDVFKCECKESVDTRRENS